MFHYKLSSYWGTPIYGNPHMISSSLAHYQPILLTICQPHINTYQPYINYYEPLLTTINHYWLVVEPPLWKIWARQLGWWHSLYIWENKIDGNQTTHHYQPLLVTTVDKTTHHGTSMGPRAGPPRLGGAPPWRPQPTWSEVPRSTARSARTKSVVIFWGGAK